MKNIIAGLAYFIHEFIDRRIIEGSPPSDVISVNMNINKI